MVTTHTCITRACTWGRKTIGCIPHQARKTSQRPQQVAISRFIPFLEGGRCTPHEEIRATVAEHVKDAAASVEISSGTLAGQECLKEPPSLILLVLLYHHSLQ
ncbi:hypothetical protein AVEN_123350-1 [Araneus ventricosus]|uniref:Uncharacterized protein n=1 Tax=Araneus ventricosus TaxID=182803 RepID=A0A4Y2INN5_ARAVE|nr:hypothetical protein AVEN_123350-1 [Araneus ventricosus]